MDNKKFMAWIIGIPLLVIILTLIVLFNEPKGDGISRGNAYRAAVLAMTTRAECENLHSQLETSRFPEKERNNWYVKYMDYLYERGYISEELTPATAKGAADFITYGEAEYLASAVSEKLNNIINVNSKNRNRQISKEQWMKIYNDILKYADSDGAVKEENILLYGTPLNLEECAEWTAYTSKGEMAFEGIAIDSYIDKEISILYRNREIIAVKEVVSESVVYENVWLDETENDTLTVYYGNGKRKFNVKDGQSTEDITGNIADIHMKNGDMEKITLKKERIRGKVMSVKDNSIEIEDYGEILLDDNFKIYKTYGQFAQQRKSDILVGYDIQEFIIANGKICAAVTVRAVDAKKIRVLLMDSGFTSIFHSEVTLSFKSDVTISYGDIHEKAAAGETLTLGMSDERFDKGRLVIEGDLETDEISITSIERSLGIPSYGGRLEIKKEADGIVIVNELYIEDYLVKVIPSEMPGTYEKEALKAQAVCARTYAFRQIRGNSYSAYGAHVDDSTRYQVYNNISTDERTRSAVNETYGQMLFYNGTPAETYYFATSCGHTTDGTIWGASIEDVPYLQGVMLDDSHSVLNITTNDAFSEFIKNKNYPSYEADFPMYRWETRVNSLQLAEKITGIGSILDIKITERGAGGIARTISVEGSDGSKTINGQGQIRSMLGNSDNRITKNDGDILTGWDTLPSAFIAIEQESINENNVITYHIYGGGFGHGVGMSQNGAQGMAKRGMTYEEILKFFYDGVEVKEQS